MRRIDRLCWWLMCYFAKKVAPENSGKSSEIELLELRQKNIDP